MSKTATIPLALVVACALASSAQAQSAWVGQWVRVPGQSRLSARSFTLAARPGGRLAYDDGERAFILSPRDTPAPELFQPNLSVLTEELTPTSFRYVETLNGRPLERVEQRLSPDGARLVGRRISIGQDGRESAEDIVSVRIGPGEGLAGAWRELPPPRASAPRSAPHEPARPYWDISESPAGVLTWRVLRTGEVLQGAADGRPHPVVGPTHPPGRTFVLKRLSPRHAQFFFFDDGHPTECTDERLSSSGRRWTDLIWTCAHPDEKDRLVYRRE